MNQKVKVGIIGFGRMGGFYLEEMRKSDQWEVLYICDTDQSTRFGKEKVADIPNRSG